MGWLILGVLIVAIVSVFGYYSGRATGHLHTIARELDFNEQERELFTMCAPAIMKVTRRPLSELEAKLLGATIKLSGPHLADKFSQELVCRGWFDFRRQVGWQDWAVASYNQAAKSLSVSLSVGQERPSPSSSSDNKITPE